jgi:hypothetical protein
MKSPKHEREWKKLFWNKLGHLAQGIGNGEKGANTIFFIPTIKYPWIEEKTSHMDASAWTIVHRKNNPIAQD